MTAVDALRAIGRRWYVLAVGLALTLGGVLAAWPSHPVYSARTSVVFLWPGSVPLSRTEDGGLGALVNFAAMVRRALPTDDGQSLASASFGGTLAGAGVRSGYTVELPNSGGQWAASYDQPRLMVEAVGGTSQEAVGLLDAVMADINRITSSLQSRLGVPVAGQIAASWTDPTDISVTSSTAATRVRGAAALGVFGGMATVLAAVAFDKTLTRKPPRVVAVSSRGGPDE